MEQLHAHEVLHMMEGNSYTELSLREAIIQKFGEQQRFFTCSANNMDVDTLIEFLKRKGKNILLNHVIISADYPLKFGYLLQVRIFVLCFS